MDVLTSLVSLGLLVASAIHLAPVPGVLGEKRLMALYGVAFDDANVILLMRHRAALFGLLGTLLLWAVFDRSLQAMAFGAGLVSVLSFFWIARQQRPYNAAIARVVLVDVIALIGLIVGAIAWWLRQANTVT